MFQRVVKTLLDDSVQPPYLSTKQLGPLKEYKYVSPQVTSVDMFLNRHYWQPLVRFVPKYIHPNVLTLTALFFSFVLAYWPQQFFAPYSDRACPSYIYLLTAVSFFIYQSLDAIDGKQARRQGLSSPLGQLFDHGCDALTTFYSVFIIVSTLQLGLGPNTAIILHLITFQLFYYGWYEYTYGVFKTCTSAYAGVTEGQLFIIGLNLISFFCPELWRWDLSQIVPGPLGVLLAYLTLHMPLHRLLFWPCVPVMSSINIKDIRECLQHNPPKNKEKAQIDWMCLGTHLYCQAVLCLSGVITRHPFAVTTTICFYGALVMWKLILSSLLKTKFVMINRTNICFYIISVASSYKLFGTGYFEALIINLNALWGVFIGVTFVVSNMKKMSEFLEQPFFTVPEEATQRARDDDFAPAFTPSPILIEEAPPTTALGKPIRPTVVPAYPTRPSATIAMPMNDSFDQHTPVTENVVKRSSTKKSTDIFRQGLAETNL